MRLFLIGCLLILTACSQTETQLVMPEVDEDLRTICPVEERGRDTLKDVALIVTDLVEAVDCANGKIVAIDRILDDAEVRFSTQGSGDPVRDDCYRSDYGMDLMIQSLKGEMVDQTAVGPVLVEVWDLPEDEYALTFRDEFKFCIVAIGKGRGNRGALDFIHPAI